LRFRTLKIRVLPQVRALDKIMGRRGKEAEAGIRGDKPRSKTDAKIAKVA